MRAKLVGLEETRVAVGAEIEHLRGRMSRVEDLERDREALLDTYAQLIPEQLRELDPEQRRQGYPLLRIRLIVR